MGLRIDGVDISHWQSGSLNFEKAKEAGVKWVYHKCTEGETYTDPRYATRRQQIKAAGLAFGAYHFARPSGGAADARREARHFKNQAQWKPGDMRPMLDLEVNDGANLTEWVRAFLDEMGTDDPPFIYTHYDLGSTFDSPLWVARYHNQNAAPNIPSPWGTYTVWQFSNGVYGDPNSCPGLGRVDLNTVNMDPDEFVDVFTIKGKTAPKPEPAPVEKERKSKRGLRFGHASMQFSDKDSQQRHDVREIFSRKLQIITGTEAGPGNQVLRDELEKQGRINAYRIHRARSVWVAVAEEIIHGPVETGYVPVISHKEGEGRHSDRGIAWITFPNDELGTITVGAGHYLAKARDPKSVNHQLNKRFGEAIGEWAEEKGAGKALVFYGGDQNLVDRNMDTFFGAPMTSCWDELNKWPGTGHGNIDVIASYDRDGRVQCNWARVLGDKELFLHTDHKLVEAGYAVRIL